MVTAKQLRVNLGKPLPKLNTHECVYVHQGNDEEDLEITSKSNIRVVSSTPSIISLTAADADEKPEDGTTYDLPPNPGTFPLYNVVRYKESLPEAMMLKGGCFMPVQWTNHAISVELVMEIFATALRRSRLIHEKSSIQDYAVIKPNHGVIQFVSVRSGSGYSVEVQITSTETVGGIQIIVTPIKRGPTQFIYIKRLSKGPLRDLEDGRCSC
ncbi:hypothetical protein BKA65DRAFT_559406 [Rhexocercosporidium sp. MPI-PUGE-AT-0058]|nr:hypothetical protein BKA65DRAFT_559406 [Rhexocercosporidium sp. MPI-PUGE-AT-0058]